MRARVLLQVVLAAGIPAGALAQAHGPAPATGAGGKAAPNVASAQPSAQGDKADHPPAQASKDAHAPVKDAPSAEKAEAHGDEHAAPQAKPKPKVSSVAAPSAHSVAPAAESHGEASHPRGGYVATGSKKAAAAAKGKAKPVVSAGAVPDAVPTKADAGHDAHGAPASPGAHAAAAGHGTEPAAAESHAATAAPATAAPSGTDVKKPAKLSDVHERLTEVLAGFHAEAHGSGGGDRGGHGADADGTGRTTHGASGGRRRADGAPARISVRWPGPRWTVAWPGPPRLTLTWPDTAPKAASPRAADPH